MRLKNRGRQQATTATQGTTEQLVDRATGALRAGLAARTVMDTVTTALSKRHVGEDFLRRDVVYVYSVAVQGNLCIGKRSAARGARDERSRASRGGDIDGHAAEPAGHGAKRDVYHIVGDPASIGEAGRITSEWAHALASSFCRCGDGRVQAQHIGDGAQRRAGRNRGTLILRQRQQVVPWSIRDTGAINGIDNARQHGVEHEIGKLRVVFGLAGAKRVLGAGADDYFVDERVA